MPGPSAKATGKPRVPVTIITGFLGAGKTSLLNHILRGEHGRRLAVLVNDFGSVNIDASLIDNQDGEVVSLENGCICCSLSDGLLAAAIRLIRRDEPPEHIIIETSGVSDPMEVAHTFGDAELQPYAPLDGIVTVVDAELAPTLEGDMLPLAQRQVAAADVAILNKTDLVDEAGRERARGWVRGLAPNARTLDVTHGRAPLELILGIGRTADLSGADAGQHREHSHAPQPFETYTYESEDPLAMARLHAVLSRLPKTVFRAKGILNLREKPGNPCILQATGRRATLTVGEAWGDRRPLTQIVFIGTRGGVDGGWLEAQLNGEPVQEAASPVPRWNGNSAIGG